MYIQGNKKLKNILKKSNLFIIVTGGYVFIEN